MRAVAELVEPSDYVEPFVGGAAVFLASAWPRPVLGDINKALIGCYEGLARDAQLVRRKLAILQVDIPTYARMAKARPRSATGHAARLLYLNRTAYGGIYRENAAGRYNVPFAGDRGLETVLKGDRIEETGTAFKMAVLSCADFEETLGYATPSSLIFCDPPYSLPGGETVFRRYSGAPFVWQDQVRLAKVIKKAVAAGATAVVSNSSSEQVHALYPEAEILPLVRRSTLGRPASESKESVYALHADPEIAARMARIFAACLGDTQFPRYR